MLVVRIGSFNDWSSIKTNDRHFSFRLPLFNIQANKLWMKTISHSSSSIFVSSVSMYSQLSLNDEHRPPPPPIRVDSISLGSTSSLEMKPLPRLPDEDLGKRKKTNSKGSSTNERRIDDVFSFRLVEKGSGQIDDFPTDEFQSSHSRHL